MKYWPDVPCSKWSIICALKEYDSCVDAPLFCVLQFMLEDLECMKTRQPSVTVFASAAIAKVEMLMALNCINKTSEPNSPTPTNLVKSTVNVEGDLTNFGSIYNGLVTGRKNDEARISEDYPYCEGSPFYNTSKGKNCYKNFGDLELDNINDVDHENMVGAVERQYDIGRISSAGSEINGKRDFSQTGFDNDDQCSLQESDVSVTDEAVEKVIKNEEIRTAFWREGSKRM
ncbi:hypothetical protein DM01DRAFT_1021613 [Hesseltinella vesiculosa]|uniref:Uncharacterized protein n=1 Tax=Hesseltinella vesiculosa TaxID=101127 RepID=A0A1X2GJM7_9FUNG|nr:hypothetical protein DM01DRAFT_1021613 [Hesseltinella vesiculosa]